MKKTFALMLAGLLLLVGCSQKELSEDNISTIRNISKLYTIDAFYNNVAKGTKKKGTGILNIGEKDREFWVEYKGAVKLGLDLSNAQIQVQGNKITIKMPDAQIIGKPRIIEEEFNDDSYTIEKDGIINANILSPEDTTLAIEEAQVKMVELISQDRDLHKRAQDRAKVLVEEYIKSISKELDREYEIIWQ